MFFVVTWLLKTKEQFNASFYSSELRGESLFFPLEVAEEDGFLVFFFQFLYQSKIFRICSKTIIR